MRWNDSYRNINTEIFKSTDLKKKIAISEFDY